MVSTASWKLRFSLSWRNRKISPALPVLKHLKIFFSGITKNEGVLSWLKGLRPFHVEPVFLSWT